MRHYLMPLAASFVAMVAAPSFAAAQDARVTADLNMRAGPSTNFPVVDVIPESAPVDVHGCVRGYSWCDVSSQGSRGWVSANYLSYASGGSYVPLLSYTEEIDVPIITFSVGSYWDSYYRDRPWYGRRAIWRDRWRDNWRDIRRDERADRRRDRREDRAERRENRRDAIRDRRRENRAERRENRRDAIRDRRRENRVERGTERRTERRVNRVERRSPGDARQRRREGAEGGANFRSQRSTSSPRSGSADRPQRSGRDGSGRRERDN
jgi:uncharacterized protein YraI